MGVVTMVAMAANRKRQWVYYAERDGLIKIGVSSDVPIRIAKLCAKLLAVEPSGVGQMRERQVQRRFAHLRAEAPDLPQPTEWFRAEPELLAWVSDVAARGFVAPQTSEAVHGTLTAYTAHRCRCDKCTAVAKAYHRNHYLARKQAAS